MWCPSPTMCLQRFQQTSSHSFQTGIVLVVFLFLMSLYHTASLPNLFVLWSTLYQYLKYICNIYWHTLVCLLGNPLPYTLQHVLWVTLYHCNIPFVHHKFGYPKNKLWVGEVLKAVRQQGCQSAILKYSNISMKCVKKDVVSVWRASVDVDMAIADSQ